MITLLKPDYFSYKNEGKARSRKKLVKAKYKVIGESLVIHNPGEVPELLLSRVTRVEGL